MKSSRSRSRNKNRNNNRPSGGNIVNRVFDSSGPEGKVRGTPQQIIEKYNQLHRDAVLSGDRVNAENFAQHAEHYTRMLAEAQREIDAKREQQEQQNRDRQAERDRERNERLKAQEEASNGGDSDLVETPEQQGDGGKKPRKSKKGDGQQGHDQGGQNQGDQGPGDQPKKRRSRKPKADNQGEGQGGGQGDGSTSPEAAE